MMHKETVSELRHFTIKILQLFFHFLLAHRRQTLRHTSTLQTYWNTLCLVRRRETGLMVIETHVKDGMVGVRSPCLMKPFGLYL